MTHPAKHATITTASHIGDRTENEDTCRVAEPANGRQLAVVCDGVGGETAGRTASETAADAFVDGWRKLPKMVDGRMEQALIIANASAGDRIEADIRLHGMATTLLAVELDANGTEWISVGDSPLWHWSWNRRDVRQLNQPHNAPGNPHVLTSAIQGHRIPHKDRGTIVPAVGDLFIAASDGLDTLGQDELLAAIHAGRGQREESLATSLVRAALDKGAEHQDNVTVVVLEVVAPDG